MLSGAKHLQYPVENKQMQILRFAQDDSPPDFFRCLLKGQNAGVRIHHLQFTVHDSLSTLP